jgi:hypothetical protein
MTRPPFAWIAPWTILAAGVGGVCRADVVYDSMVHTTGGGLFDVLTDPQRGETSAREEWPGGSENEAQAGQAVTLSGTARFVTAFEVPLTHGLPSTQVGADVTLSIFADAGGAPGAPIWSGSTYVTVPAFGFTVAGFALGVEVPDTIFFALTWDNISAPMVPFGVSLTREAPLAGAAASVLMQQDSTTLLWGPEPLTPVDMKIQARITAVPPPAGTMLLGLALTGGVVRRATRRTRPLRPGA